MIRYNYPLNYLVSQSPKSQRAGIVRNCYESVQYPRNSSAPSNYDTPIAFVLLLSPSRH